VIIKFGEADLNVKLKLRLMLVSLSYKALRLMNYALSVQGDGFFIGPAQQPDGR